MTEEQAIDLLLRGVTPLSLFDAPGFLWGFSREDERIFCSTIPKEWNKFKYLMEMWFDHKRRTCIEGSNLKKD